VKTRDRNKAAIISPLVARKVSNFYYAAIWLYLSRRPTCYLKLVQSYKWGEKERTGGKKSSRSH